MAVIFHIPGYLRPFTGGCDPVELGATPATVGAALEALWTLYPGVRDRVVTEQGAVRQHVNVFVGSESIRFTGGLATPVSEGSEIAILPAVSGGADETWSLEPGVPGDAWIYALAASPDGRRL